MRISLIIIAIVLGQLPAAAADSFPDPGAPRPIYTRQTVFGIPFFIDPAEPGARRATEVQLHVSENGSPWRLYSKAPPDQKSFVFRATRDGEYRFMVRTRDDRGEVAPSGPPHAEMVVVLDTDPPVLELVAEWGAGGDVHARYRVRDAHLKSDSLRLEYQVGPDGPWLPVAVDLPPQGATNSARDATWVPDARATKIAIRTEVSDLAGNIAKTQKQITRVRPKPEAAADGRPAGPPANDAVTQWPGEKTPDTPLRSTGLPAMAGSFPNSQRQGQAIAARATPAAEEILPQEQLAQGEPLPAPTPQPVLAQPSGERRLPISAKPEEVGLPPAAQEPHEPPIGTRREVDAGEGPWLPSLTSGPPLADLKRTGPQRPAAAAQARSGPGEPLPADLQPRMVNSRRFELEYDVEAAGPVGLRSVETWGTRDGGRTWTSYGLDDDHRSPIVVSVDSDGIFGFRIVVESMTGLRGDPPRAGDVPDVWVGVDTIKPFVRLLAAELAPGPKPETLTIRWEAGDALLAAQPVSLFFSDQATGPWQLIAEKLQNSGQFTWRIETGSPDRVFLRVEVRDQAGNVASIATPDPVSLLPAPPKGHIRDVRPVGQTPSAEASPDWRDYRR